MKRFIMMLAIFCMLAGCSDKKEKIHIEKLMDNKYIVYNVDDGKILFETMDEDLAIQKLFEERAKLK